MIFKKILIEILIVYHIEFGSRSQKPNVLPCLMGTNDRSLHFIFKNFQKKLIGARFGFGKLLNKGFIGIFLCEEVNSFLLLIAFKIRISCASCLKNGFVCLKEFGRFLSVNNNVD
jgi:hypothetical protein